jgi:hypothetical protein
VAVKNSLTTGENVKSQTSATRSFAARSIRSLTVLAVLLAANLTLLVGGGQPASAFGAALSLNSAGGTTVANGLKFVYGAGQFQANRLNAGQVYGQTTAPSSTTAANLFNGIYLSVGTTTIGPKNGIVGNTSPNVWPASVVEWDSITTAGGATGSGTITSTMTKLLGGLTYKVDLTYIYTTFDDFVTESVVVTVPAGHPAASAIKWYHTIDAFLGGSDAGPGFATTVPSRMVGTYSSTAVEAFRYRSGLAWTGYVEDDYTCVVTGLRPSYDATAACTAGSGNVWARTNYNNTVDINPLTDSGFGIMYDLATAPGTQTFSNDLVFTENNMWLEKAFGVGSVNNGSGTTLTYTVYPAPDQAARSGVGFVDTFPAGLTMANNTVTSSCGGTPAFTDAAGGVLGAGDVGFKAASISRPAGSATCTITINVIAPTGTYVNGRSNMTYTFMNNLVTNQTLVVTPVANLSVTATAPTIVPGGTATTTLTIANAGPDAATTPTVTFNPPTGTTVVVASLPAGCSGAAAGPVSCNLATLANAGSASLAIPLTTPSGDAAGTSYTGGTVAVSSVTTDLAMANNSTTVSASAGTASADLAVTVSTPTITPGTSGAVTVTAQNIGPSDAAGATVSYTPPTGTTVVIGTLPAGCAGAATGPITCTIGALVSGASSAFNIEVAVPANAVVGSSLTGGTGSVTATTADPASANNAAPSQITVGAASADLAIAITTPSIVPGLTGTASATVTNNGPSNAPSATVTYNAPVGAVVTALPSGCTGTVPGSGPISCTVAGPIALSGTAAVDFTLEAASSATPSSSLTGGSAVVAVVGATDPATPNNTAVSGLTTLAAQADVATAVSTPTIAPGATGNARITLTNGGPSDAAGPIVVTYSAPTGTTITVLPAGCTGTVPGAGPITCTLSGPLANTGTVTIDVPLSVPANATPGATLTGGSASTTTGTADPVSSNELAPSTVTVGTGSADLSVTSSTPAIVAGGTASVTLTIANAGPSDAAGVTATYSAPTGLSITALPAGCTGTVPGNGPISCTIGALAASGSSTVSVSLSAPASLAAGTINGGSSVVAATTADPATPNNTAPSAVTLTASIDLATSVSTPTIVPGTTGTATITVTNGGVSDQLGNFPVTYSAPTGATITVLPSGCTGTVPGAGPISCTLAGPLVAGGSRTLDVTLSVPAGATPLSTLTGGSATATPTGGTDPDTANNTAPSSVNVDAGSANVGVAISTPSLVPGTTGTATITVSNAGPSNAAGPITVTYAPPTGAEITSLPAGCTGTLPLGPLSCTLAGPLAPGSTPTIVVPLKVVSSATPSSTLTGGTATASSPTSDPAAGNNSTPATVTTLAGIANLATATSTPSIAPGATGTVTVTVTNAGPSDAAGPLTYTYTPPTGVDITSLPAGCTGPIPAGPITCVVASGIANGGTATITVPIKVQPGATPSSTLAGGAAGTTSPTSDPVTANNTAPSVVNTLAALADLSVTVSTPSIVPGQSGIATVTVVNGGPSSVTNPVVVYSPPASAEITALPSGCVGSIPAGPITCTLSGTFPPGTLPVVDVPLHVPANAAPLSTLAGGSAVVTAPNATDPTPSNNSAPSLIATLAGLADVSTTVNTPVIEPGTSGFARITVSNAGPSDAAGPITVTYAPPAGVDVVVLPSGCTGTVPGGPITCTLAGPLTPGVPVTVDVKLSVPASAPAGTTLSGGTASATSVTTDPAPANNTTPAAVTTGPGSADLGLLITTPSIAPGSTGTATIAVSNSGPSDAAGPIVVSYSPPAGVDIVSLPADCAGPLPAGPLSCTLPAGLAVGATATIPVDLSVPAGTAPGTILGGGSGEVTSVTPDPVPADNAAPSTVTTLAAGADLHTTITTPSIVPGAVALAVIRVVNNGPLAATGPVVVNYTPPAGALIVSLPASCTGPIPAGPISCTFAGPLAVGQVVRVDVSLTLPANTLAIDTLVGGSASASSATSDPNPVDNVAPSAVNPLPASADVSVTVTTPTIVPGTDGNATITVSNSGPSDAAGPITVNYSPPADVEIVSLPTGCTGPIPNGPITCTLAGPLVPGSTLTLDVPLHVPADAAPGTLTDGSVSATSVTQDPNPAQNSAPSAVTVASSIADVSVAVSTPAITPGTTGTAVITATNHGPSEADGPIHVTYSPPAGVDIVGLPAGCTGVIPAGPIDCTLPGPIPVNGSVNIPVVLSVPAGTPAGPALTGGSAMVATATTDPTPANNTASSTVATAPGSADLRVETSTPTITPGGTGVVAVTVTNGGPAAAAGPITVGYTPPAGVGMVSRPAGCTGPLPAGPLSCTLAGPLAPGSTSVISVPVSVLASSSSAAALAGGSATVASPTTDPQTSDNTAPSTVRTGTTSADLSVTTTTPSLVPGTSGTADVVVANAGPSDAAGPITVSYSPPVGVQITALPAGCTGTLPDGPLTCTVAGPLAPGTTVTIVVPIALPATATSGSPLVGGSASVQGPTSDPNATNDTTTASMTPAPVQADLAVSVASPTLVPGTQGTATVTVSNIGPSSDAGPLTVTFTPPTGTEIVVVPGGCTGSLPVGPLTCTVAGPIAPAQSAQIAVVLRALAGATPSSTLTGGSVSVASPTSASTDPVTANNTAPLTVATLAGVADLSVTVATPSIAPGATGIVPVTLSNAGPSDAAGPIVTVYSPPAGLEITSLPSGCIGSIPTGPITCTTTGPIVPGTPVVINVPVHVPADAPAAGVIVGGSAATSSPTADPIPTNNSAASTVSTVIASADLVVSVTTPTLTPGVAGSARIIVGNNGPSDAAGPIVVTYLPPVGVLADAPVGCVGPNVTGEISCTFTGPVAPGVPLTIDIPLYVGPDTASGSLAGGTAAATSATADPVTANNTAPAGVVVAAAVADLAVAVDTPFVAPGGTGVVAVTVTNAGPSDTAGPVVVTYAPPAGVDIISVPTNCAGTIPAGPLTCTVSVGVVAGGAVVIQIPVSVPAGTPTSTPLGGGSASVTSPAVDPTPLDNTAPSVVAVAPGGVDLTVTVTTPAMMPGDIDLATLTASNTGPTAATGPIVVSFSPPAGVAITALPAGCTGSIPAGPISCTIAGPLAPGASVMVDVPLKMPADATPGATLTGGSASISGPTTDVNPANNTAPATILVGPAQADVSVTVSTPAIAPGGNGTAVATIINHGPATARGPIVVTYAPPASVEIVSLPGGCTGPIPNGPITCTLAGPLSPLASLTIDIPLRMPADAITGTSDTTGAVSVTSATPDPTPANNNAPTAVTVAPAADDLAVTSTTPVIAPGSTGWATVMITNNGPADANGPITVTYAPPVGVDIVALPADCTGTLPAGPITCTRPGPLVPGATINLPIQLFVPASAAAGAPLTGGTVSASGPTTDGHAANNSAPVSVATAPGTADLTVGVTTPTIVPGGIGTATLTVRNDGPSNAAGPIVVAYTPPTGVDIASLPAGCTGTLPAGPISCTIAGPLTPGSTVTVDVPLTVAANTVLGPVTGGSATASSPTPDLNPSTNSTPVTAQVVAPLADLSVAVTTPTLAPGTSGTATVTVANAGPSDAAGPITVTYEPPAGLEIVSRPTGCSGTLPSGPLTCTVAGPLEAGAQVVLSVPVMLPASAVPGAPLTGGSAGVASPTADPNPVNDTTTVSTTPAAGSADVTVTVVTPPIVAGTTGTAVITAANVGTSNAAGPITVTYAPPVGISIVALPADCTGTLPAGPITCTRPGPLAPETSVAVPVLLSVPASLPVGPVAGGSASANAGTTDPVATNNATTSPVTVSGSADLGVTTTKPTIVPGETGSVVVTVANAGPSAADGPITVTYTPPAGVEITALPAGCTGTLPGGPLTCTVVGPLAPATSVSVTIPVRVLASAAPLTPLAGGSTTVASPTSDPVPANNILAAPVTTAAGSADVSLTVTTPAVVPGTTGTATLHLANVGPSDAAGPMTVLYTPPAGVSVVLASLPAGCAGTSAAGPITCTVAGPLATGAGVDVAVPVSVASGATPSGTLTGGAASVSSPTADPAVTNNSAATDVTTLPGSANVTVAVAVPAISPAVTGQVVVTVTNHGPSDAAGPIVVNFTPPTGMTIASLPAGCTGALPSGPLSCTVTDVIVRGAHVDFRFDLVVPAAAVPRTLLGGGIAIGSAGTADPEPADNTAAFSVEVGPGYDLTPVIDHMDLLLTNKTSNMDVTVRNDGAGPAPGASFQIDAPAGLQFQSGVRVEAIGVNKALALKAFPLTASGLVPTLDPSVCEVTAQLITCQIGDMVPNSQVHYRVVLLTTNSTTEGVKTFVMGVRGARGLEIDSANNSASTTGSLRRALPVTGGNLLLPIEVAAGALASGLLLVFVGRRRRTQTVR